MASLITYDGGLRRIEFTMPGETRKRFIRLGRATMKQAEDIRRYVEVIAGDIAMRRSHDAATADWLGKLPEDLLGKLRAVGLADGVGMADTTLGEFLDRYFTTITVKPSTATFYGHTRRNLEEHFGKAARMRSIGAAKADGWRAWLVNDQKLSTATVGRRVIAARTLWKAAIRWKLAADNPFTGVKGGRQTNEARTVFVPRDVVEKAIAATTDLEWRAIIALARYAGLRTPSETFALRWSDIDIDGGKMIVRSSKLAHHEGGGVRTVPLFKELEPYLTALMAEAEPGEDRVIVRNRLTCGNLRTQLERILKRAKLAPWPRLFHNLRGSRETELMAEYDLKTVCKWIGNSPAIAAAHYASSRDIDADFARASGKAQQKAQQKAQYEPTLSNGDESRPRSDDDAEGLENKGNNDSSPLVTTTLTKPEWAIQDSNL